MNVLSCDSANENPFNRFLSKEFQSHNKRNSFIECTIAHRVLVCDNDHLSRGIETRHVNVKMDHST